jgi:hypothetical protein
VQDRRNWQFNENGVAGSAEGHSPICLLEGSADLDPDAVTTGSAFPCCSDCMDGCGGWPASEECHDDAHTSADGHGICDCDGRCDDVIPGYRASRSWRLSLLCVDLIRAARSRRNSYASSHEVPLGTAIAFSH